MKTLRMKRVKKFYVIYFNGFSLKNEEVLFKDFLYEDDTCVVGFSYGAQKALEYVYHTKERIDKLILLSPAFFQTEKPSFIRTQLRYFEANKKTYVEQFLMNVVYPSSFTLAPYLDIGTKEELEALLSYKWDKAKIQYILDRGISIEVFLGMNDKIIDSAKAKDFFSETITYLLRDTGHILKEGK